MEEESLAELVRELRQLRTREVNVVNRIERLTELRTAEGVSAARVRTNRFGIGNRVRITNKVKKPAAWPR